MRFLTIPAVAILTFLLGASLINPQTPASSDVRAQLDIAKPPDHHHAPAAVLWLKPIQETPAAPFITRQTYTLLQKNRTFKPHVLVVPVGGVVQFPNADPFFHNVFSLFDGKRFDLGLYEAGSTKSVTFSREGVSYIFCNIHPEMSAVILALSSRLFAIADPSGSFQIPDVPSGDYEVHVWIEGVQQPALNGLTRRVHVSTNSADLGRIDIPGGFPAAKSHTNMFGQPYDRETKPTY